jgi:predicted unusual protein kinase regulating ubiquinone biosynthesis (AarF/ABC1/UbiB family)
MIDTGYKKGLKLPAELTLLAKALFNLDAVTRALDPTFNPQQAVRDYTSSLADERARRDFSPRRLYQIATEASDFLGALPHRLDVITKRIAANDVGLRLDTPQLGTLLEGMQKIANRIFTGLVLAGLLVASGLMIQSWPRLGIIGFTIAAVLAVYMVVSILLSDRKRGGGG